jgi:anthranilate phosphoribosyltransferase
MMRSVSIQELAGFREALLDLCVPVDLSAYNTIDLCGTGGDGKDTLIFQLSHL